MPTISSRDFNQRASEAKRAADEQPVFITDRGRPSHVLLSIAEYRRITGLGHNIADLLAMPGVESIDLELPDRRDRPRVEDLLS